MKKILAALLVIIVLTTMTSCLAIGTGDKKTCNRPTLGQELLDLQKARAEGAISSQEYTELKKTIKKSYDQ